MQGKVTVAEVNGHGAAANVNAVPAELLVVDDEPVTARGYARALAAAGYKVTVAHDGREASVLAKGHRFDAIISDIAMPDMDGLALLRVIRETDLDVPMIFMTGSPALESALAAIEYGAFRYLVKPVGHDAMMEAVARAVGVHKLARVRREAALMHELAPTSRRCAARSTSSTRPSGSGRPPSWGGSSASTWRSTCITRRLRPTSSSISTRPIWRTRSSTPTTGR
jgi:CheY-like chemotaxis protein